MNVELHNLVAVANEAHVLLFGDAQRSIGHHVEQANVQFTNVLFEGVV